MSQIVICDGGKPREVADLCRDLAFGIEIQGLHEAKFLGDTGLVQDVRMVTTGIDTSVTSDATTDLGEIVLVAAP